MAIRCTKKKDSQKNWKMTYEEFEYQTLSYWQNSLPHNPKLGNPKLQPNVNSQNSPKGQSFNPHAPHALPRSAVAGENCSNEIEATRTTSIQLLSDSAKAHNSPLRPRNCRSQTRGQSGCRRRISRTRMNYGNRHRKERCARLGPQIAAEQVREREREKCCYERAHNAAAQCPLCVIPE